jgi:hypothetical protein
VIAGCRWLVDNRALDSAQGDIHMQATHAALLPSRQTAPWLERLNTNWHEVALRTFMVIVLAHWAEHLTQAFQIYVLGWPVPQSRGVIGYFFPWMISSEVLHYAYAVVMLVGLFLLRPGFTELNERRWWTVALAIQFFHHFEHGLLQYQAITGQPFFGRPVVTSIVQLWVPRVELHLFYNTIVFIPMIVAMYYHLFPAPSASAPRCTCAWHRGGSPEHA